MDTMVNETNRAVDETNQLVDETVKKYEIRPLVASDMGIICKIITAIGVRQFKECFHADVLKGADSAKTSRDEILETVGFGVAFDIAGIVISNIPKAEEEIHAFIASLTGLKCREVKNMPLAEYGEIIIRVITNENFKDFFRRVMKLFNR